MRNAKAAEREQLVYELGLLFSPLRTLCEQSSPPRRADFRVVVAKVQAGDREWRKRVAAFTTLAPDVILQHEFQDLSHVPERLWQRVKPVLEDPNLGDGQLALQEAVKFELTRATESFFTLVGRVPLDWEPMIFEANTPFTSYLRVLECTAIVRSRLHYFDRYLKPEFFELFLRRLARTIEIRLVTTTAGVREVSAHSGLFRREWKNYQLLELAPSQFHDRNLRVDEQVFTLGPGVDRVGVTLTNFGPADSSAAAHVALDALLARAAVAERSL
jgi:hypothetical protein